MKHSGHKDERTFDNSYMPNNAGTDLQEGYFDGMLCSIVTDCFGGMTLHRNPDLLQILPARKQHELENTQAFIKLEDEIEALAPKAKTDPAAKDYREALIADKRKLVSQELLKCQKLQLSKLLSIADNDNLTGYHRTQFYRVCRLIPK